MVFQRFCRIYCLSDTSKTPARRQPNSGPSRFWPLICLIIHGPATKIDRHHYFWLQARSVIFWSTTVPLRTYPPGHGIALECCQPPFSLRPMLWNRLKSSALVAVLATGNFTIKAANPTDGDPLAEFEARATKYHSVVSLPEFESTPEAVKATVDKTIAGGNAGLDAIGRLPAGKVNFDNTIRQLDDIAYLVQGASDRLGLIEQTSTNAAVRDAATDQIKKLSDWSVGTDYREDVYAAVKAFAN